MGSSVAVEDNALLFSEVKAMIGQHEREMQELNEKIKNKTATKEETERIEELNKELADFYEEFGKTDEQIAKNLETFNVEVDEGNYAVLGSVGGLSAAIERYGYKTVLDMLFWGVAAGYDPVIDHKPPPFRVPVKHSTTKLEESKKFNWGSVKWKKR